MSEFWERVERRWDDAVASAETRTVDHSAQIRLHRFWLRRPTMPIVITGMRGAGKSVVFDAIAGSIGQNYKRRGESDKADPYRISLRSGQKNKVRSWVTVVPGADSDERAAALQRNLQDGSYPTGVIHVVCAGFNEVWEGKNRLLLSREMEARGITPDLAAIRERNQTDELDDFTTTCELLDDAWKRRSVWLVIAVTKCDLFWDEIDAAKGYYVPEADPISDGLFVKTLRDLVNHLGDENLDRVAVMPMSSLGDPYTFSDIASSTSQFDDGMRAPLVDRFRSMLGEFSGR